MEELIQIENRDSNPVTSSLNVAEVFNKRHADVLRSIENLDCSVDFTERNFALSDYIDSTGRALPMAYMTKNGFSFLVMGFTGKKAAQFKEMYIARFDAMERKLLGQGQDPNQMSKLDWIELAREQEVEKLKLLETNDHLNNLLVEAQPQIDFVKSIECSKTSITVAQMAKLLSKKGFNIGQKRLFNRMKGELNLLQSSYEPYQRAIDNGWLEVKQYPFEDKYGTQRLANQVLVTGKGQTYIEKKLREQGLLVR